MILTYYFAAWLLALLLAVLVIKVLRGATFYRRFQGRRLVTCPETRKPAAVTLDASRAAVSAALGEARLRIQECSRWPAPKPDKGERRRCGQHCLAQIEAAPEDCLIKTMLARWYAGKNCVLCRSPIGEVDWLGQKPAVMGPDRNTVPWDEVAADHLPEVLASYQPVCWNCHVAESFRRQHPELVVDRVRNSTTASKNGPAIPLRPVLVTPVPAPAADKPHPPTDDVLTWGE